MKLVGMAFIPFGTAFDVLIAPNALWVWLDRYGPPLPCWPKPSAPGKLRLPTSQILTPQRSSSASTRFASSSRKLSACPFCARQYRDAASILILESRSSGRAVPNHFFRTGFTSFTNSLSYSRRSLRAVEASASPASMASQTSFI
jgi:hypothetical protein